jgi:hypothetical protein
MYIANASDLGKDPVHYFVPVEEGELCGVYYSSGKIDMVM